MERDFREVERHEFVDDEYDRPWMAVNPDGEYVWYTDYQELLNEIDRLRGEIDMEERKFRKDIKTVRLDGEEVIIKDVLCETGEDGEIYLDPDDVIFAQIKQYEGEIDRLRAENDAWKKRWEGLKTIIDYASPRDWERVLRSMTGLEKQYPLVGE